MKTDKLRETAVNVSIVFSALVFLLILGAARLMLNDARKSVFEDTRLRAEISSKMAGKAMFPKEDLFSLHFLVNSIALDKAIKYAVVADQTGKIRSHSDPDKIGGQDESPEAAAARASAVPLMQSFKGPGGLEYFYFSEPITVGKRRLGTLAVAINSETMKYRLAATKHKLVIIFIAALGAMGLLLEIRSLLRREQRSSAVKSAMVHTVSHEFNNALTVIDAVIFLLQETEPEKNDPARGGLYRTLAYERKSLKNYVKNILSEARMEAGRFKIEKKPLVFCDLVSGAVSVMEELMRKKKISFTLDMTQEPLVVNADFEAMALVLSNLVGNAVKYTPENGRIAVRLAAEKAGQITFRIENSGRGITAADLEKIKTEFFRTGEGQAAAEGFGLGLKICNDMLLLHGSSLEIKSEMGKNVCFCFSLPVSAEKASGALPPGKAGPKSREQLP
ncbi:MAG: HAMP domain-containing sensor histidine kinase [Elusimicrobiales bacterium]|nr:HAMP domain-containing sensor histidine kinase [Elusimicrobiales bacterium]